MKSVTCVECGDPSDRGCIQICRKCSPLKELQYLGRDSRGVFAVRSEPASDRDYALISLADLDWARRTIRESGNTRAAG